METSSNEHRSSWKMRAWTGILTVANLAALWFGIAMLGWVGSEMGHEGERWGLLGVMIFGGVALPVMLLLLLGTVLLVVRAKRGLRLFGLVLLLLIGVATITDLVAVAYVLREPDRHERKFVESHAIYTSGLHDALEAGDVERASEIIGSGQPGVTESDYYGFQPLHIAAKRGDKPMVEMLLARGCICGGDHSGRTPLHFAVQGGHIEIVKLLLDNGVSINKEDSSHKTALAYALELGNEPMVALLRARGGTPVDYEEELIKAVEQGDKARVGELLAKGVTVTTKIQSLLHYAAEKGNVEMAEYLLSKGSAVDAPTRMGTPLHLAANEGHAEMVRFLLSKGANPNAKDQSNSTPLCWAVWYGRTGVVKVLLEKGADPNAGRVWGTESCLHAAKRCGHSEIVELLAKHGAKE